MKRLILFTACLLTFSAFAQPDTSNFSRMVLQDAVDLWRSSYKQLVIDKKIYGDTLPDTLIFNHAELQKMYDHRGCDLVNFWMYADNINGMYKPLIAVSNNCYFPITDTICNDTSLCSGVKVLMERSERRIAFSELNHGMCNWHTFTSQGSILQILKYSYPWDQIRNMTNDFSQPLSIELIAHTISPGDPNFELPSGEEHVEGYIAIDILFHNDSDSQTPSNNKTKDGATISNYYNFAMPCPKACPKANCDY